MADMHGKTAVITGASRGIGKAIAHRLAAEGCDLVLADIDQAACKTMTQTLPAGPRTLAIDCDVSQTASIESMAAAAIQEFGTIDYLVNNAAVMRNNYLTKTSDSDWENVLAVNLGGPFRCIRAIAPHMITNRHGKIVNISSGSSAGMLGQANYASSKAGIYGLTKTAALELARFNINVNVVSPGFVVTDLTQDLAERAGVALDRFIADAAKAIPLQRAGQPHDIAGAVHFLLSDDASFITGQILNVRGGPGPAAS